MKQSAVEQRLEQINARLFGLESRMNTFERVAQVEGAARKELLEQVLENQKEANQRQRKVELKLAAYAGGVLVLGTLIDAAIKLYLK